jgi:magnesium chelatase family protein
VTTLAEAIQATGIDHVAGLIGTATPVVRAHPFLAFQRTILDVGLIGGGQVPLPGEVSLAHNGVRCLDERPEFRRQILEVLRQPIEESVIYMALPQESRLRAKSLGFKH